jgi:hypothetical protein
MKSLNLIILFRPPCSQIASLDDPYLEITWKTFIGRESIDET